MIRGKKKDFVAFCRSKGDGLYFTDTANTIAAGGNTIMLREEFITYAAAVHMEGARFLRDGAAALLPCCTLLSCQTAFALHRALAQGEFFMQTAVELSGGLTEKSAVSKYTPVIEARMRLAGVDLDATLTSRQQAAERIHTVAPGTRRDIFDGFIALSQSVTERIPDFLQTVDTACCTVREGRTFTAVPYGAFEFIRKICADYAAACKKLVSGESAQLVRRADTYAAFKKCLQYAASAQGADALNASCDTLAALASGGLIPQIPPVLFDMLLRYENLFCTLGGEQEG